MYAVYIMPRIAKKTTEKLRKKAIRRKSLRQKKRTIKKKNNARRTRRNMRKRNKRGGSSSQAQTGNEIDSAMERFTDSFNNEEEEVIAKLMMKENNKVIRIMNPNGTVGKEIEVLKSIKDKLRKDGADLDEQFHHYLCEKLQITIDQLRANPQGIIRTAHELQK